MGQSQLGHAPGGSAGGVLHGHALFFGIFDVYIVHADAAADDELQLALSGLVDMIGANLGLGADHDGVEVLQRGAQLIGLVELLHDLMAHFPQGGHGLLVHTVGNQNTHDKSLLFIIRNSECGIDASSARSAGHRPAKCLPRARGRGTACGG